MVMVFTFEMTDSYCQDAYLAQPAKGTHPGACVRVFGGLLFYPQQLMFQETT